MITLEKNERLFAATVRNRAEQIRLESELAKIEREKENELRYLKVQKQKFRTKYSNLSNEADELAFYEYYKPSSYLKIEREKDLSRPQTATTLHFKNIHSLIFTNGEVDIEKIICLHLLCIHRTETLTPPKKKVKYLCKEHSPTERLIDRSKRGFTNYERLSKLLPLYALELVEQGAMGEKLVLINDGRLAARIIVNDKVMELINTVVTALEQSNVNKFRQLLVLGNNPTQMRKMLSSRYIAKFFESLSGNVLINSCESFVLTPPFKIKVLDLNVRTNHGNLEQFVNNLRQNVLQQPARDSTSSVKEEELIQRTDRAQGSFIMFKPKMEQKRSKNMSPGSSKLSAKLEVMRDSTRGSLDLEKPLVRDRSINFIAKNKKAAASTRKIEYDTEDDDMDFVSRRSSTSSGKRKMRRISENINSVKNVSVPIVEEKPSIEEKFVNNVESQKSNENESESLSSEVKPKRKKSGYDESKYHLREVTCPACMEKWKKPLPAPKTPRVKKSDVLPDEYSNNLRTNSHHRISMMINKAMYKLQSYDRKYSSESERFRRTSMKKGELEDGTLDDVYLNPTDLAKIEQEIREMETQKKLEKFLKKEF